MLTQTYTPFFFYFIEVHKKATKVFSYFPLYFMQFTSKSSCVGTILTVASNSSARLFSLSPPKSSTILENLSKASWLTRTSQSGTQQLTKKKKKKNTHTHKYRTFFSVNGTAYQQSNNVFFMNCSKRE